MNQLQTSLDHPDVSDTWFDHLELKDGPQRPQPTRKYSLSSDKTSSLKLTLSGRYLVRLPDSFEPTSGTDKRNYLIELNSKKQEALTNYLQSLSFIDKIEKKTFSIEGEGDLFERYFTHFKYVFKLRKER